MTTKPYIAELHDIGKLVDREALQQAGLQIRSHTYHSFDFSQLGIASPSSPSWWGQWSESIKSLDATSELPSDITDDGKVCVVLTNIADELAASISRTLAEFSVDLRKLKEKGKLVAEGLYLLWNPMYYSDMTKAGSHWAAFRTRDELKQMFDFIDRCQALEEFFEKYGDNLSLTAEDKSAPWNIIPLGTHLDLTGKVFRVLRHWSKLVEDRGKPRLEYDKKRIGSVIEAAGDRAPGHNRGKWVFRLVQCHVRFPQSLVRLQDLNMLRIRREKIEEIVVRQKTNGDAERQPYAVLFHTDDFLSLFLPRESIFPLRQAMQPLIKEGFWLEYEELEAELNLLTSAGFRTRQYLIDKYGDRGKARARRHFELRYRSLWPDLEETVMPPLCDLCQLRRAEEKPYVKDQVREWLCPTCRKIRDMKIRDMGEPATTIDKWDEEGKPVVWLKASLDQNLLLTCLKRLFNDYVDHGPGMDQVSQEDRRALKDNFRPLAAQMEFVRHYKEFLKAFRSELSDLIEPNALIYPIHEYDELAVVRIDQKEILGQIMDAFYALLQQRFPACLPDCPIRLSLSLSNVKYPYGEHWRFFEEKQESGIIFDLQQPGVRRVKLTALQFQALREGLTTEQISHFLHRLTEIAAAAGELMATVEMLNERRKFPQIQMLLERHKLTFRQILDFYRLVGVQERVVIAHG